jgi:dienelactone hydrolase
VAGHPPGELVERRAAAARSTHPVAHLRYPATPASVSPAPRAPTEVCHPVDGASYALGGMPAANAAARADSWPRVLAFLAAAGS